MYSLIPIGPIAIAAACCGMVWFCGLSGFWAGKSDAEFDKGGQKGAGRETIMAWMMPWVALLMLLSGLLAMAFYVFMAE